MTLCETAGNFQHGRKSRIYGKILVENLVLNLMAPHSCPWRMQMPDLKCPLMI